MNSCIKCIHKPFCTLSATGAVCSSFKDKEKFVEREAFAQEIFEEIENLAKIYTFPVVKKGVIEIVKEPFWCIEPSDLAELKKKYTGENGK